MATRALSMPQPSVDAWAPLGVFARDREQTHPVAPSLFHLAGRRRRLRTMVTDRRPSRGKPRQEYDESSSLTEIQVPHSHDLIPLFGQLESARDAERREPLNRVCQQLLDGFAEF